MQAMNGPGGGPLEKKKKKKHWKNPGRVYSGRPTP